MSKIPLTFAELHSPLFFAGKSMQMKLDPSKRTGLSLVYDRKEKELLVTWEGQTAIVPISNVVAMVPGDVAVRQEKAAPVIKIPGIDAAQVDSPVAHVHAGPGHGKTK